MSRYLHDNVSLFYSTFFVERYINQTSRLLLTDTDTDTCPLPHKQYDTRLLRILLYEKNYYKYFYSRMRLLRQCLHGFINPRPPLTG